MSINLKELDENQLLDYKDSLKTELSSLNANLTSENKKLADKIAELEQKIVKTDLQIQKLKQEIIRDADVNIELKKAVDNYIESKNKNVYTTKKNKYKQTLSVISSIFSSLKEKDDSKIWIESLLRLEEHKKGSEEFKFLNNKIKQLFIAVFSDLKLKIAKEFKNFDKQKNITKIVELIKTLIKFENITGKNYLVEILENDITTQFDFNFMTENKLNDFSKVEWMFKFLEESFCFYFNFVVLYVEYFYILNSTEENKIVNSSDKQKKEILRGFLEIFGKLITKKAFEIKNLKNDNLKFKVLVDFCAKYAKFSSFVLKRTKIKLKNEILEVLITESFYRKTTETFTDFIQETTEKDLKPNEQIKIVVVQLNKDLETLKKIIKPFNLRVWNNIKNKLSESISSYFTVYLESLMWHGIEDKLFLTLNVLNFVDEVIKFFKLKDLKFLLVFENSKIDARKNFGQTSLIEYLKSLIDNLVVFLSFSLKPEQRNILYILDDEEIEKNRLKKNILNINLKIQECLNEIYSKNVYKCVENLIKNTLDLFFVENFLITKRVEKEQIKALLDVLKELNLSEKTLSNKFCRSIAEILSLGDKIRIQDYEKNVFEVEKVLMKNKIDISVYKEFKNKIVNNYLVDL